MTTNGAIFVSLLMFAAGVSAQDEPIVEHLLPDDGDRAPLHTVVPAYPEKARQARCRELHTRSVSR